MLISIIIILISIGLIFIYASSSVYALEATSSPHYYVIKQLTGVFMGILTAYLLSLINVRFLRKMTPLFLLFCIVLVALTFVPVFSSTIHGSHRWLKLGVFSFQPSEFLKMALILYLAHFLSNHQFKLTGFSSFSGFMIITALPSLLVLIQPDFGQAITYIITALIMYFCALGSLHYILYMIMVTLPIVVVLILGKSYRLKRILIFLNPWKDPQGAGFQIIQSLIAIGSGHMTGVGLGQSKQKFFYLPMIHTDFIFSIIAEETGIIGSLTILFLYVLLTMGGIKLALMASDYYPFLVISGFFSLIALETCINIGVATALLPTKGLGLPFISYGKSSLIAHMSMCGIIYALIKEYH